MKYLTLVVPCYNSEAYMERCVDSLLAGGSDVEIIIVDDGSTDWTGEIADNYARNYPDIVKVVHKENGGHGSGVNTGMALACGLYFKVVDSDDWLDERAYIRLLAQIKAFCKAGPQEAEEEMPDLFVCNYVYDHCEEGTSHTVDFKKVFPTERLCTWDEMGHFSVSQYLVMHALVYRTELLHKSGLRLPEHTFYVDNLFAVKPLVYVEKIYYMDLDLYHYYLGRDDQSVNENVLMKRIDQHIKVTKMVAACVKPEQERAISPKLRSYLCRNLSVMMAISSVHLLLSDTGEARRKREALWQDMRRLDQRLYYRLRYRALSGLTYLPGRLGECLTLSGYRAARKLYRFQ